MTVGVERRVTQRWPDGPSGRRLVGVEYDYRQDPIRYLREAKQAYGDAHSLGPQILVLHNPTLIGQLLARTNGDFTADLPRLTSRASTVASDEAWPRTRRTGWAGMTQTVARARGLASIGLLSDTIRRSDGQTVAVAPLLSRYACSSSIDLCLGPDAPVEIAELISRRTESSDQLAATGLTYPSWWPSRRVRSMIRAGRDLDRRLDLEISQRLATPRADPRDLLDLMVAEAGTTMAVEQIRRLIKANLLASNSAPGAALAWVVWELSRRPELASRIAEEIEQARSCGRDPLTTELDYTSAVVRETLRLHPPIWLIARAAARDCELGPWQLRSGQRVVFSPYLLHRDERWWPEPELMLPQRWLAGGGPAVRGSYLPFSGGPRVCLGIQLALFQLQIATAWLVEQIDITVFAEPATQPAGPTLMPDGFTAQLRLK